MADITVYARTTPEHKLRLVRALHERGAVVAVTDAGVVPEMPVTVSV